MADINMEPALKIINNFKKEISDAFFESMNSSRQSIRDEEYDKAMKNIYSHRDVNGYAQLQVSKDNYKTFVKIYQVIDVFKKEDTANDSIITQIGKKYGFGPEQSLNLYHMAKYEVAIENLRSQKAKVAEFALSEG